MRYKNKKSGVEINTHGKINGKDWEEVKVKKTSPQKSADEKPSKKEEE